MPVSPLKASLGQLKGCRHTLFRQKKIYLLYNEGEAYAKKMDEASVPVSLVRIRGRIHDHGLPNPLANISAVQATFYATATELKKHWNWSSTGYISGNRYNSNLFISKGLKGIASFFLKFMVIPRWIESSGLLRRLPLELSQTQ